MGRVTPMPSRVDPPTSSQRGRPPGSPGSNSAATRHSTARAMLTPWRRRLWVQPGVSSQPWSLAIATIEPLKVMAPTNTETAIDTRATMSASPASKRATPTATSREAMPPQPLNRATVSGMAVIGTRRAVTRPASPPAALPAAIHSQAIGSGRISISSPTTARPMARAARPLAPRAERTLESPLMPRASSRTAARSMAPAKKSMEKVIGCRPCGGTWRACGR